MTSYIEHQQSVLGAIFLESHCLDEVSQIVKASDFDDRHGRIYQACVDIATDSGIPDLVTVSKLLPEETSYLVELIDFVPTVANVGFYAKGVADFGQRRNIGAILNGGMEKLRAGDNPIEWIESQLSGLRGNSNEVKSIKSVLKETIADIDRIALSGEPAGYKIGIQELDEFGLFQDGDLVVVAGRPGMGKSVIGAQYANSDKATLIFTLEMSNNQLCKRLIASESKVDLKTIRRAEMNSNQSAKMGMGIESLAKKNIYFCEASGYSIQDIRAASRIAVRKHGIKKIVVDYIQLCHDPTKSSREQEISSITRNLKQMAQELNVSVMALSQLNRELEKRVNKRPLMADLRESGAIEQDADAIIFAYRDHVYDDSAPERKAELIIGKFRNGEPGYVECLFIGEHQLFASEFKQ
jgi:replicative DNA helicase